MPAYGDLQVEFEELDVHVRKAKLDDGCSFSRLKGHILSFCPPGTFRTLFLCRGIVTWLLDNYTCKINYPEYESPLYWVKEYQEEKLTINSLINVFCSEFHIPSRTIHGLSKRIQGDPHRRDTDIRAKDQASWNAIKIDGKWFLLNTDIIFSAKKENDEDFSECKEITSPRCKTTQLRPCIDTISDEKEPAFDDFWFLTSPELFINFCFPDEPTEQFLHGDAEVSYHDFLNRPLLHPAYFRYHFDVLSKNCCKLFARQGQCGICLYTDPGIASLMELSCDLYRLVDCGCYLLAAEVTSVMLTKFRTRDTFIFDFRFVEEGRYRAVLYCEEVETTVRERCCEFEIDCSDIYASEDEPRYMSANMSNTFGIGPAAIKSGIVSSSQEYPRSFIQPSDKGEQTGHILNFQLSEDALDTFEYQVGMEACNLRGILQSDHGYVSFEVDKDNDELEVTIKLPRHIDDMAEEFVVTVSARRKEEGGASFDPVYYHLLSTKSSAAQEMVVKHLEKRRKEIKRDRHYQTMEEEEMRLEQEVVILKREIGQLLEKFPTAAEGIFLVEDILDKDCAEELLSEHGTGMFRNLDAISNVSGEIEIDTMQYRSFEEDQKPLPTKQLRYGTINKKDKHGTIKIRSNDDHDIDKNSEDRKKPFLKVNRMRGQTKTSRACSVM